MAFKPRLALDCETAYALGAVDKNTGKKNPTTIEGYYLGAKEVPNKFSKTGTGLLYIFQTVSGCEGVFGKTDLDRKMQGAPVGTMLRVSLKGKRPTKYGDMPVFLVEEDASNTIDVSALHSNNANDQDLVDSSESDYEESDEVNEVPVDEIAPPRASKPAKAAMTPHAEAQARLQNLLKERKTRVA